MSATETERQGLSEAEAAARLAAEGPNELRPPAKRNLFRIAAEVLREPLFQLLLLAGLIYLAIGDPTDALMLLGFALVNVAIMTIEERRTERVLETLRDLTSPRALIIRGGVQRRIPGREVVCGDLLVLEEGDRVPADGLLLSANDLEIDESLLTGESVPAAKQATRTQGAGAAGAPEVQARIFAATMVVRGQGTAQATATGRATEVGKIGEALGETAIGRPAIEQQIRPLVRWIAIAAVALALCVVLAAGFRGGDWLTALLAGITIAMSLLPQEFPLVMAVFFTLGAWRLSQRRVLVRRPAAIENLGAATVLCVDKTGTLTENRMSIGRFATLSGRYDVPARVGDALPEDFHALLEFGILACERMPFDPMERAFYAAGERYLAGSEHLHGEWELVHEYPLSRELLAMSHVWRAVARDEYVVAAKGAPEAIVDLCHMDATPAAAVAAQVAAMAAGGLRVLAVAKANFRGTAWPAIQHDFSFEFLGLIGLADPLRETVPAAIAECRSAGMRVVMITGDHPETARAIADQAGLLGDCELMTGAELDRLDDGTLAERIDRVGVFARTTPAQKLRIVETFKSRGEIAAMTGDGVNDAPSLKAAHIGIAMGKRGTDVAREAAALVLLDDDFASIVAAARMGRRIFDNLSKAMAYLLAVHVPIAGLALLPLLFGWPPVLTPIHIVFLELVIDPVSSIVFEAEPEERGIMRRPPRRAGRPVFGAMKIGLSLFQGASVLAVLLVVLGIVRAWGHGVDEVRALVFVSLVIANISLIFANRSWSEPLYATLARRNPALWWATGATLAMLALVLALPPLRTLFHFEALHGDDLLVCLGAGVAGILWFEGLKLSRRLFRSTTAARCS